MKIFNLKNTIIATTLLASSSAMASFVGFDRDGLGATFGVEVLQKLNLESQVANDSVFQDLGLDGILNNGDTFTESLYFKANSAVLGAGFFAPVVSLADSNGSTGFYSVSMDLIGHIDNYSNTGGDITTTAGTWGNIATSTFDIVFDFKDAAVTLDWNDTSGGGSITTIGVWDVLGGISEAVSPQTGNSDFAIALAFDEGTDDDYFKDSFGGPISSLITINQAFGLGSGSGVPVGIVSTFGPNGIIIASSSNNAAARFNIPEPTTVALLGLGLLGFAGARRRNS